MLAIINKERQIRGNVFLSFLFVRGFRRGQDRLALVGGYKERMGGVERITWNFWIL